MTLKRREFLLFLGAGAGSIALQPLTQSFFMGQGVASTSVSGLPFKPVKGVMPLFTDGIDKVKQVSEYSKFAVADDVVLPEGYTYSVVASWGDRVGDSHFGYNNDYISFVETAPNEGYLTVNHEYVSALPWQQTYEQVLGKSLPLESVQTALAAAGDDGVDAYALADTDPIKAQIQEISKAGLIDLGLSVISIRKEASGQWVRTNAPSDRRITGISGLEDNRYLKSTGPAVAVFRKTQGNGYTDALGDRIIGTFNNCSGGTTPWGTVLSGEENFQNFVPEPVHADGTSLNPAKKTFGISSEELLGIANPFGLAGNKYGWVVEVDPANPNDYGTKHTWIGRYRHEGVGIRAEAGKKLAFYSGCDRRGGHLYKFVSAATVSNPKDKANSQLLSDGMLYAAKFNADGTGSWIALKADTPVNPELPSTCIGGMLTLPNPDRVAGGIVKVKEDGAIAPYKQQFKTLGDLYQGNAQEKQGAILIDAHYAANAAGATSTARPEDTEIAANGSLFIAFTSGAPSDSDGGADARVFKGPNGETSWEYGWIMRLDEDRNDPAAMGFKWSTFATGGEPADGGLGFSNPDNLEIDAKGNIWIVVDMSSDKLNKAIPVGRKDSEGKAISQSNMRAIYGNNTVWYMPTAGANAGKAFLFATGPMDAEMTGPFFTQDQKTLFLSAQHPGEYKGVRQNMASETRKIALKDLDGKEFEQTREVPVGSNWPAKTVNAPPKPSVIAIRRIDGGSLT